GSDGQSQQAADTHLRPVHEVPVGSTCSKLEPQMTVEPLRKGGRSSIRDRFFGVRGASRGAAGGRRFTRGPSNDRRRGRAIRSPISEQRRSGVTPSARTLLI